MIGLFFFIGYLVSIIEDYIIKFRDAKIIMYRHHNKIVCVKKGLKGQHRDYCLCWNNCKHFKPSDRSLNCPIANELFNIDVKYNIVTPVWECPNYEKEINNDKENK